MCAVLTTDRNRHTQTAPMRKAVTPMGRGLKTLPTGSAFMCNTDYCKVPALDMVRNLTDAWMLLATCQVREQSGLGRNWISLCSSSAPYDDLRSSKKLGRHSTWCPVSGREPGHKSKHELAPWCISRSSALLWDSNSVELFCYKFYYTLFQFN